MSDQAIALIRAAERAGAESLSLGGLGLTALPDEVLDLADTLADLDLSHNRFERLPAWIGHLARLRSLDLSHNQIVDLPRSLYSLGLLTRLDLTGNLLVKLPAELGGMPSLESLQVAGNRHLIQPPPGVVAQGSPAVIAYVRESAAPGVIASGPPRQPSGADSTTSGARMIRGAAIGGVTLVVVAAAVGLGLGLGPEHHAAGTARAGSPAAGPTRTGSVPVAPTTGITADPVTASGAPSTPPVASTAVVPAGAGTTPARGRSADGAGQPPASTTPAAGTYQGPVTTASSSVGGNIYLDVNVGQPANGTAVDTATWDDYGYDDNQVWTVVVRADGTAVLIPHNATGSYLTWLDSSTGPVGGIWQQSGPSNSSTLNDNQFWRLVAENGGYRLVTTSDGDCLTAGWPGPTAFPGTTYLAACQAGDTDQVWRLPA